MFFATFYIIANIFQSYELWLLYRCFFGKSKRGAGIEFLAFVLFFAVTMLLNVFIDIPILTGLSSYVMLVLIAFFGYESGWKQGLLYSVFAFVSMTLAECIVGLATGFLDLNVFQSREYYNVWGMVALPVVQYLVVLMIRNFRNLQKGREIPILYWAVTIVLPVFSLYLDLMICQQNFYWLNMLGCTVILFVMNVLVFYLCDVQIENMRVRFEKEKLEQLGIPVLVERSSYESGPLARLEWLKFWGILLGKEELAEQEFARQVERLAPLAGQAPTGKRCAFFSITANNLANVRKGGDYVARMIEMAGADYVFADLTDSGNSLSTMNLPLEDFYAGARDADFLIYNSTIEGVVSTTDELVAKCSLLADFKAVQNGHVWCVAQSFFQQSMELADFILELHRLFTEDAPDGLQYFIHVE